MKFPDSSEIKQLRKSLDLTQSELANLSNVSQSTIAKIERGRISGSYEIMVRIFSALYEEMNKRRQGKVAKDVASKNVVGINIGEKVKKASEMMREKGFSQLPVFDGDRPIGSISEFGILRFLKEGVSMKDLAERSVESVMDESFPIVSEETPLEIVTSLLSFSKAVLVARRGKVTGIITSSDVLKLI
ncbi:MAG: CBS domain-containing protein [Methanomassiliicoccales archaeon]|jgi:predicted transcriptional regulator|nr:CBS domain-containing protein [Methanomassiliicoccales archaeon]